MKPTKWSKRASVAVAKHDKANRASKPETRRSVRLFFNAMPGVLRGLISLTNLRPFVMPVPDLSRITADYSAPKDAQGRKLSLDLTPRV